MPWGIWIFASHGRGIITHFHPSPFSLFMTGLQCDKAAAISSLVTEAGAVPVLSPPSRSITVQTRDSIIAISRVSPLTHSVLRLSASKIAPSSREIASCHPCHNSASFLISLHAVRSLQQPTAGQPPPIAAEWGLQCQAHCSAHVIIEILPELLIEEFYVTTLIMGSIIMMTVLWHDIINTLISKWGLDTCFT